MIKLNKNSNGFTVVEGLLIVLVIALIGFGGYYVWHTQHKTSPAKTTTSTSTKSTSPSSTKTTTAPNPYAGWKTYTLGQFSFKYPTDWSVTDNSNMVYADGTEDDLVIESASFTTTAADSKGLPNYFIIDFSKTNAAIDPFCTSSSPCKVTAVTPLSNSALSGDVLTLYNIDTNTSNVSPQIAVTKGSTKVGDTTVTGASAEGDGRYTSIIINYGNNVSPPGVPTITNPQAFVADSNYQELINLINSINYK
ncbi:MAG TPA: hypothetical protein VMR34_04020 [Candidatus Saccharimonadales bacterium]|jgi:hypothetical protein|nr:hypothetical protein [Candidatus Saccharimonadales bacterium]